MFKAVIIRSVVIGIFMGIACIGIGGMSNMYISDVTPIYYCGLTVGIISFFIALPLCYKFFKKNGRGISSDDFCPF
jgi:hypothetical protein